MPQLFFVLKNIEQSHRKLTSFKLSNKPTQRRSNCEY